jgi:hypothetical protein
MAKNLGREYATMSEEERRRFAMEEESGDQENPTQLDFDDPRREDGMGEHFSSLNQEIADPEHRDGLSADLDDQQHQRAVREEATRGKCAEDEETTKSRTDDV